MYLLYKICQSWAVRRTEAMHLSLSADPKQLFGTLVVGTSGRCPKTPSAARIASYNNQIITQPHPTVNDLLCIKGMYSSKAVMGICTPGWDLPCRYQPNRVRLMPTPEFLISRRKTHLLPMFDEYLPPSICQEAI